MGAKTLLTAEQFDNYPFEEDKRYELDEGELIEMTRPGYEHNRILRIFVVKLGVYFLERPIVRFSSLRICSRWRRIPAGRPMWQLCWANAQATYVERL